MKRLLVMAVSTTLTVALLVGAVTVGPVVAKGGGYEVWIVDQSDTRSDGGGTLYIYPGPALEGAAAVRAKREVIDLGGAARSLCLTTTGTAPRRPHMLTLNAAHNYAILSFVATGHVLFMEATTRAPIACIDVGAQAHAAFPAPDDSYVVVANQNGKLLQRIQTDYGTATFQLAAAATLNLATCTTPNGAACQGALRPDNAPICPVIDASSRFTFVTLRGGGLLVVDSTRSPMAIVAEYDASTVHPNGCGGMEAAGRMFINSGGGTAANPLEADLYAFPMSGIDATPNLPNTPAPSVVFSHDSRGFVDSHGTVLTKDQRFLWVADRAANRVVVVDTASASVVGEFGLTGAVSADPAPDLMGIAPAGNRVFVALRGPNPLTANVTTVDNAVGATPGLGIMRVTGSGRTGVFQAIAPISHVIGGVERADPHGIAVRRTK